MSIESDVGTDERPFLKRETRKSKRRDWTQTLGKKEKKPRSAAGETRSRVQEEEEEEDIIGRRVNILGSRET